MKRKRYEPAWTVEREGDPDCDHRLEPAMARDRLDVSSGIVFASFECARCGRMVSHAVGELFYPWPMEGE